MIISLRVVAVAMRLAWLAGVVALFVLMALPHVLPALGRQMYIVRGASMQPAIPIGAIVVVNKIHPDAVATGDIVTFRAASGTVVTHRVTAVNDSGELTFSTKGDANASADPVIVPASAVVGRVEEMVPGIGTIMTALGTASGSVAALGVLGALLLAGWFIEELVTTLRPASVRRTVAKAAN